MIPLYRPWLDCQEEAAVLRLLRSGRLAGNGVERAALERELRDWLGGGVVLALSSATHALELMMLLLNLEGGEVIVPSFTFPSVGCAILRAGGVIRFCEVREPDLNVDLDHARSLVGPSTRALVVTHYAGHPQDFTGFPVPVVEDAAHALGSRIDGRSCGTVGQFGCLSFHLTKNLVAGEGGALLVRDEQAARPARIVREKGTNREDFAAGRVDHYAWVGLGSSLVMPELSAAIARVQLGKMVRILEERRRVAELYDREFYELEHDGRLAIVRPVQNGSSSHHIYAILVDPSVRTNIVTRLAMGGVQAASHFVPLHESPFGRSLTNGLSLPRTERVAASIIRLPIYPGLSEGDAQRVVTCVRGALGA
jgi:dTDP-4-amino-4,6-dideoxygalactose transaminase